MRQCMRCGNPMSQASKTEWECGSCGIVLITSYERNEDVHTTDMFPPDEHSSTANFGVGGAYLASSPSDQ